MIAVLWGTNRRMPIRAVLFDLGGVVLDSPLDAFAAYERELGLPVHTLNKAIVGAGHAGAWARLERGELTMREFFEAFDAELAAGQVRISAEALMAKIADNTQLRPAMLTAIRTIRSAGLKVGALTNNWASDDQFHKMDVLRPEFDVFIESAKVGLRKPDPKIYDLACRAFGVKPADVAFLDDIGGNLKAARALGMTTLKVTDYRETLRELGALVKLELLPQL
jgi:putative hydrolase of the HAD superfamily